MKHTIKQGFQNTTDSFSRLQIFKRLTMVEYLNKLIYLSKFRFRYHIKAPQYALKTKQLHVHMKKTIKDIKFIY